MDVKYGPILKYLFVIVGGNDIIEAPLLYSMTFIIFYRKLINMVVIIRFQINLVMTKQIYETANLKFCGISKCYFVNNYWSLVVAYTICLTLVVVYGFKTTVYEVKWI